VAAADRATFGGIILGNGGTGKTTLVDYLYQDYLQSQLSFFRSQDLANIGGKEFVEKYYEAKGGVGGAIAPYRVTGTSKAYRVGYRRDLVDTPGQAWRYPHGEIPTKRRDAAKSRKITAWSEKIEEVMRRDHCLIVNVMSWGHSAAIRRRAVAEAYGGSDFHKDDHKDDYLRHMREAELGALRCAIAEIRHCVEKGWRPKTLTFVNLVNMAGFWWGKQNEASAYYEKELRDVWDELVGLCKRESKLELTEFAPVSLLFDDLTTEISGKTSRQVMFGVEAQYRDELIKRTVEAIDALERALYGQGFKLSALRAAGGEAGGSHAI
jgi:hypothetical protein